MDVGVNLLISKWTQSFSNLGLRADARPRPERFMELVGQLAALVIADLHIYTCYRHHLLDYPLVERCDTYRAMKF